MSTNLLTKTSQPFQDATKLFAEQFPITTTGTTVFDLVPFFFFLN